MVTLQTVFIIEKIGIVMSNLQYVPGFLVNHVSSFCYFLKNMSAFCSETFLVFLDVS